ncbi:protein kinase, partial [Vibrio parahaemolyticus]
GRVLLVRDIELDRTLALKTLLDRPDEVTRLRLAEEAQLAGQLAHPNIVPVHELGWHQGGPFVAMKFVEGRDLKSLVRELREKKTGATAEAYGLRRR